MRSDGIVAYTATATDKAGRSIPAPGLGILSTARQLSTKNPSIILNLEYRKRQLAFRRKQISEVRLVAINVLDLCTEMQHTVAGQ